MISEISIFIIKMVKFNCNWGNTLTEIYNSLNEAPVKHICRIMNRHVLVTVILTCWFHYNTSDYLFYGTGWYCENGSTRHRTKIFWFEITVRIVSILNAVRYSYNIFFRILRVLNNQRYTMRTYFKHSFPH